MNHNRRTVVEIRDKLHKEIRKIAVLNDLRMHEVVNEIIEEFLRDEEKVKALIKRLSLSKETPRT